MIRITHFNTVHIVKLGSKVAKTHFLYTYIFEIYFYSGSILIINTKSVNCLPFVINPLKYANFLIQNKSIFSNVFIKHSIFYSK